MPELKIKTRSDKAAFMNRCNALGVRIATTDLRNDPLNKSIFYFNATPTEKIIVLKAFKGDENFEISSNDRLSRQALKELILAELTSFLPSK